MEKHALLSSLGFVPARKKNEMMNIMDSIKIQSVEFRNRIGISPMCMYSATDGVAEDWHLVHYGSRALGGAGLIILEAAGVSENARITPGDLGLYHDKQIEPLKRITRFLRRAGSVPGIQLAHAGRKAGHACPWEGGHQLDLSDWPWKRFSPSLIPFQPEDSLPHAMNEEEIQKVIVEFKEAALRALEAGFQIIEIHAAHGYLVHQFLSPLTNLRQDEYGGSFKNRIRFILKIVEAVSMVWPEQLPLFVRISATDWLQGGWTIEESIELAIILKQYGVDLIDVSSGGNWPNVKIPIDPGYQVVFSERIKREANILTAAVGLISNPEQIESILKNQQADLILIGRASLRNANFPQFLANELGQSIPLPNQYLRANWEKH